MDRGQPGKRRRIHLDVMQSVELSQSEEGSASLRQPVNRNNLSACTERGMEPCYHGHSRHSSARRPFRAPRRIGSEEEQTASTSASCNMSMSVSEKLSNSPLPKQSCKQSIDPVPFRDIDLFESQNEELEMELVKQSSDQAIHQAGFQGFTSAAHLNQFSSSHPFNLAVNSPVKQMHTNGAVPKKAGRKKLVKDANQLSITRYMVPSSPSSSSSKTSSNDRNGFEPVISSDSIPYGTSSKMCSTIRQMSDSVYVISDDSNSNCSQDLNHFVEQSTSIVKKLFAPSATSCSSSIETAKHTMSKQSSSKRKRSNATSGLRKSKTKGNRKPSNQKTVSRSTHVRHKHTEITLIDVDDEDFVNIPTWVPSVKQEIDVGKTFGLLNDSKVTEKEQNYFEMLPLPIMEKIFCSLPMLDLCLNVKLVCMDWNNIISSRMFMPWKKTYHRLKKGEQDAVHTMQQIVQTEDMVKPSLRLVNLISFIHKRLRVNKDNNICELLQQHPKYTWAVALLRSKASHCMQGQDPSPWGVVCALVMVASTVDDIYHAVQLLTSSCSQLTTEEVLECFYCIASFLLAFKQQHLGRGQCQQSTKINLIYARAAGVVNGLHYRVFYTLYLYENSFAANHSMLQEAMNNGPGQQSIIKYSRGDTEVRQTHEQMRIVKFTPDAENGQVVKIFAFAGTGKTTTLVRYAQMRPALKFLLIVFNKSVCKHAETQFPRNVTCKTAHSLAFRAIGFRYIKKLNSGNLRVFEVAMALEKRTEHKENLFIRAKFVMETLKNFLSSSDWDILLHHAPQHQKGDDGQLVAIDDGARMRYVEDAISYWRRMKDVNDHDARMTHDGYLKLYQLSRPTIRGYDIILVDEAQDTTPALLDVVQRQTVPRIFVGDQHQQIYAFRGAVNAMQAVRADKVFYLTQSFRFGPEISHVANTMLEVLKGVRTKNIVGHSKPGSINGEQKGQVAILCRSNFTVFKEAVAVCVYSDAPVRVAFVGGLEGFGFSMLEDIYTLMLPREDRIKNKREIENKFIARFSNLADLEKYADKTMDGELLGKIRIVRTYTHNLPMCVSKIREKAISNLAQADMVFSTVHKAKGLEFSTVKITDDFVDLHDAFGELPMIIVPEEEANLLYVAVTRAKHALIMSRTVRRVLTMTGGGCYQPVLTEQLKKDSTEPLRCLVLDKEFTPQDLTVYRPQVTLSNKNVIKGGCLSPGLLSGVNSEYSHLFGDGFKELSMDSLPVDEDFTSLVRLAM